MESLIWKYIFWNYWCFNEGLSVYSRLIAKHGMFKLWHLDNPVLVMQCLHLTIASLSQTQFESQMSMILCLICLHTILVSHKRHTTTSQERYILFPNEVMNYVVMIYYLFIVPYLLPTFFFKVWLYNIGLGSLVYNIEKVCDGSGEDPSCSRCVPYDVL